MTDEIANEYDGKTNDELSGLLADRDLATSGNKAELIARLEADDAEKANPKPDEPNPDDPPADAPPAAAADPADPPADPPVVDTINTPDDVGPVSFDEDRPDADAVAATTQDNGEPLSGVPNPLPLDAASGDIVSQVRRGEVDGHTITDAHDVPTTKPGDVVVSVDPFVTIASGEALAKLRENAGQPKRPRVDQ